MICAFSAGDPPLDATYACYNGNLALWMFATVTGQSQNASLHASSYSKAPSNDEQTTTQQILPTTHKIQQQHQKWHKHQKQKTTTTQPTKKQATSHQPSLPSGAGFQSRACKRQA